MEKKFGNFPKDEKLEKDILGTDKDQDDDDDKTKKEEKEYTGKKVIVDPETGQVITVKEFNERNKRRSEGME